MPIGAAAAEVVRREFTRIADDHSCKQNRAPFERWREGLPIFPELRPWLGVGMGCSPDGAVYVVERYRGNSVNLRTQFERLIKQAGLVPGQSSSRIYVPAEKRN